LQGFVATQLCLVKKEQPMQINVSGHHLDVTPALREYINSKFSKLQRHFDQITNTDVTLVVEKQVQKAEANIHVAGADLFATSESEDMYAAIDALADKLDRQLIKHKEKSVNRKHGL
jgi:putative sigma-54 modulation protein